MRSMGIWNSRTVEETIGCVASTDYAIAINNPFTSEADTHVHLGIRSITAAEDAILRAVEEEVGAT